MNKLAIFDLDGVICDLREVHFVALNGALVRNGFQPISREDHLTKFDGLPTKNKLEMLGVFDKRDFDSIAKDKQDGTIELIRSLVEYDEGIVQLLETVSQRGYKLAVVSNAKRATVEECLLQLGCRYSFDIIVTPDNPGIDAKPSPEMHAFAIYQCWACPATTVIFEDSPHGLQAAHLSGAKVVQVSEPLTKEFVLANLQEKRDPYKYQWPELNVLIPAAGDGRRFREAGYVYPKPFILVDGETMLETVHENLAVVSERINIIRNPYKDSSVLDNGSGCTICLEHKTEGTAQTCLTAKKFIDNNDPLLIANCDQILEWNHLAFYYFCQNTTLDGVVVVFDCPERDKKWSYCEVKDGLVVRVAEKDPISDIANTGIFFWKHGSDFVKYAEQMIAKDIRTNGELYLAPVTNEAIADGKKIGVFKVDKFHSLGTPEDLEAYLARRAK